MDSLWVSNTLVPFSITAGLVLLVLWPTRHSGKRLLQRWGVAEPTDAQKVLAIRYLWQRRIVYLVLVLAAFALETYFGQDTSVPGGVFAPLLAAMVIAELIATLRPVSGVREASLDRRTWRDLVPTWAVVVSAVFVVWTAVLLVMVFLARSWAERYVAEVPVDRAQLAYTSGWSTIGGVVVCVAVLAALVHLAVRRPSVADAQVDAALRTRTARVAVGIGFLLLAGFTIDAQQRMWRLTATADSAHKSATPPPGWLTDNLQQVLEIGSFVAAVIALGCWLTLAMPSRKTPVRAA